MKFTLGKSVDATQGNLLAGIIRYAIPLILSTIIQVCFNAVDLIVIGNMADSTAVASVGATTMIVGLLVNLFVGIAAGAKIILSRLFGSKNSESIQRCADTIIITASVFGVVVAFIGVPFAPDFLRWTNCPADCIDGAVTYIRIYLLSSPAILLYNYGSAIITSSGDSQRPVIYIIIGGLINVVLNILLCFILEEKVAAVAIATAVSQIVMAAAVMHRLCTMTGDGHIQIRSLRFHIGEFKSIMRQGIPLAVSSTLYPLANLQIQSAINVYGVSAIAGNSTASTIEGISSAFTSSVNATTTVFMGQNIGARKLDRVEESFRKCLIISFLLGTVLGVAIYLSGRSLCALFLPDDPVGIEYAMIRMFYITLFHNISAINGALGSAIQSYGYSMFSALSSIFTVFVFRMIWMFAIYPHFQNFHMLMACFLVSWVLNLISNINGYYFLRKKFLKNYLRESKEE